MLPKRRSVLDRMDVEDPDLPDQVRITLRIEAPAEVLEGGGVVVVLQVHELEDDAHIVDADQLWLGTEVPTAAASRVALA